MHIFTKLKIVFIFIFINCKPSDEVFNYQCNTKTESLVWGKWKEISFQKKLSDFKNFEKDWTISVNQDNLVINACSDVTAKQWKEGDGCCGFMYYELKNDTLRAGGYRWGGKGCENVYCKLINGKLIIEKLSSDSLTLINDYGRSKYLKIK